MAPSVRHCAALCCVLCRVFAGWSSAKEGGGGGNEPLRRDTAQLLPARRGGALWFVADSFTGRYLWDACRLWWRGRAGARAAARAAAKAAAKAA